MGGKKTVDEHVNYIEVKGQELGGEYADFEMLAIQILDSNWDDFPDGLLQYTLENYLAEKAKELGTIL